MLTTRLCTPGRRRQNVVMGRWRRGYAKAVQGFYSGSIPDRPSFKLPDGRKLDAGDCRAYILALPEQEHYRWEGVAAELLKAGDSEGCSDSSHRPAKIPG